MAFNTHDQERNHRFGELETLGVEPLPPTPITEAARETLLEMGLSNENIRQLRELTSSFRYDLCRDKLLRIAESELLVQNKKGKRSVFIPHFFSHDKLDGQCTDIGLQFLLQADFSGLLQDIRDERSRDGYSDNICFCYCRGQSDTHFCTPNVFHVWNGLATYQQHQGLTGFVLIDAAFQRICSMEESGYITEEINYGPQKIEEGPVHHLQGVGSINLGTFTYDEGMNSSVVIGLSETGEYAFSLGFVKREDQDPRLNPQDTEEYESLIPLLKRGDAAGTTEFFFLHPDRDQMLGTFPLDKLTEQEYQELRELLSICQEFSYRKAEKEEIAKRNLSMNISW